MVRDLLLMDFGHTLVTGGAGFIGSHLTDRLIRDTVEVTVLDNFTSGSESNLNHSIGRKGFSLIRGDLRDSDDYLQGVRTVFHMAADSRVQASWSDPSFAYEQNVASTYRLLEKTRRSDVEQIVFASSSVVYGEPEMIPTRETFGPTSPISIYGGTKLACEGLVSSYCNSYGIKGTIVRLANVVGIRARRGVVVDLVNKLKKNQKNLEVLGDGRQTKSYLHISDCVEGLLIAATETRKNVDVFNVASRDAISVMRVAETVCESMGLKDVSIVASGGKDGRGWIGDVTRMNLDVSKLSDLGWESEDSQAAVARATKELM